MLRVGITVNKNGVIWKTHVVSTAVFVEPTSYSVATGHGICHTCFYFWGSGLWQYMVLNQLKTITHFYCLTLCISIRTVSILKEVFLLVLDISDQIPFHLGFSFPNFMPGCLNNVLVSLPGYPSLLPLSRYFLFALQFGQKLFVHPCRIPGALPDFLIDHT